MSKHKVRWPWGQGMDKRQARRHRRRLARDIEVTRVAREVSLDERIWDSPPRDVSIGTRLNLAKELGRRLDERRKERWA